LQQQPASAAEWKAMAKVSGTEMGISATEMRHDWDAADNW